MTEIVKLNKVISEWLYHVGICRNTKLTFIESSVFNRTIVSGKKHAVKLKGELCNWLQVAKSRLFCNGLGWGQFYLLLS